MNVLFQRNYYDQDGDLVEPCLTLWFEDTFALKLRGRSDLRDLIPRLEKIDDELYNNYPED